MLTARPRVAEMAFQVYGRPLHPELFQVFQSRTIERGGFTAKIDITGGGHVIAWRYAGLTLTEVAASARQPLPHRRRLLSCALKGKRSDGLECRGGVRYEMSFQLDPTEPGDFWTIQKELAGKDIEQGLLYCFNSSGRMALGALSYIHFDVRDRSLSVQAFHTFPDDYAVVQTHSRFLLP